MGWRRQLRRQLRQDHRALERGYRQDRRQIRRDIRSYKKGIRNDLKSGTYGSPYNDEQFYRDEDDGMVYDTRGYICPGLVRYGGVRPGIQYKKGGSKKSFTVDGEEYNWSNYWGDYVNQHGSTPEKAAAFKKRQAQRYEEETAKIISQTAKTAKDRRKLTATKIANQANMGMGRGTQAGVAVKLGHWLQAKHDPEYMKSIAKDEAWAQKRLDDVMVQFDPERWRNVQATREKQRLGYKSGGRKMSISDIRKDDPDAMTKFLRHMFRQRKSEARKFQEKNDRYERGVERRASWGYQGGGFKGMIKKHGSAGGGMLGIKNIGLGKGWKGSASGGPGKFKANIKKTFSGRNLSLSGSGSYSKGKGFGAKLGLVKRFQGGGYGSPSSYFGLMGKLFPKKLEKMGFVNFAQDSRKSGMFDTSNPWKGPASGYDEEGNWVGTTYYGPSPAERAQKSINDALFGKAAFDARSEADAKAGGSAGFAPIKMRHIKAAKNSPEYQLALARNMANLKRKGMSTSTWESGGFADGGMYKKGGLKSKVHALNMDQHFGPYSALNEAELDRQNVYGYQDGGVYLEGGVAKPLPGGAVEFKGRSHEEGGIMLDPQTEVEGDETMDKVKGRDYFFSSHLKLGGKSFAARHKDLLKAGASQKEIDDLAKLQEVVAGRDKHDLENEKEKRSGGVRKYQGGGVGYTGEDQEELDEEADDIWEDPEGDHWNWDSDRRQDHHDYHFNPDGTPTTDEQKLAWKEENWAMDDTDHNDPISDEDDVPMTSTGRLYNGVTQEDIAPYLDEIYDITGIADFDPTNPAHVEVLQRNLISPTEELLSKYPTYFGGDEADYLSGDLTVHHTPQKDDGLFGRDTLNALMRFSEATNDGPEDDDPIEFNDEDMIDIPGPDEENPCPCDERLHVDDPDCCNQDDSGAIECPPGSTYDPEREECVPNEEATVEGCPCEDGTMSEECCVEEDVEDEETIMEERQAMYNQPKKPFPWHTIAGIGTAAAQMIPAIMAMREKPDYMGAPGRIPTIHLDRIAYNDARAANAANFHGMGRFIEESGTGPAEISNKMAAWGRKQEGDVKITQQENRENSAISNQEAQLNMNAMKQNIANQMHVDEFNAAANAANKDRRLMGAQNAVQSLAGMWNDWSKYRAEDRYADAVDGGTGVRGRSERRKQFNKANPHLVPGTQEYNEALLQFEEDYNTEPSSYGGDGKKWWKFWEKDEEPVNLQDSEDEEEYYEDEQQLDEGEEPWVNTEEGFYEDADGDSVPDYLSQGVQRYGGFGRPNRKKLRRKKQIYG